jgi:uncharacterized coiled-coil DUF342 family protein
MVIPNYSTLSGTYTMITNDNYADVINRLGATVLETSKRITEINFKAGEKLVEQQAELANQWLSATSRSVDVASKGKAYQDLVTAQAQIAQEYGQQLLAAYRKSGEVLEAASKAVAGAVDDAARVAREAVKIPG